MSLVEYEKIKALQSKIRAKSLEEDYKKSKSPEEDYKKSKSSDKELGLKSMEKS